MNLPQIFISIYLLDFGLQDSSSLRKVLVFSKLLIWYTIQKISDFYRVLMLQAIFHHLKLKFHNQNHFIHFLLNLSCRLMWMSIWLHSRQLLLLIQNNQTSLFIIASNLLSFFFNFINLLHNNILILLDYHTDFQFEK